MDKSFSNGAGPDIRNPDNPEIAASCEHQLAPSRI
jgi:hypothetical protein